MARMLGRERCGGCGNFRCRLCGPGDVRWAKRREQHELSDELAAELREALAASERGETDDLGSFAQYADESES
jgi:hypothetical protein